VIVLTMVTGHRDGGREWRLEEQGGKGEDRKEAAPKE